MISSAGYYSSSELKYTKLDLKYLLIKRRSAGLGNTAAKKVTFSIHSQECRWYFYKFIYYTHHITYKRGFSMVISPYAFISTVLRNADNFFTHLTLHKSSLVWTPPSFTNNILKKANSSIKIKHNTEGVYSARFTVFTHSHCFTISLAGLLIILQDLIAYALSSDQRISDQGRTRLAEEMSEDDYLTSDLK